MGIHSFIHQHYFAQSPLAPPTVAIYLLPQVQFRFSTSFLLLLCYILVPVVACSAFALGLLFTFSLRLPLGRHTGEIYALRAAQSLTQHLLRIAFFEEVRIEHW